MKYLNGEFHYSTCECTLCSQCVSFLCADIYQVSDPYLWNACAFVKICVVMTVKFPQLHDQPEIRNYLSVPGLVTEFNKY